MVPTIQEDLELLAEIAAHRQEEKLLLAERAFHLLLQKEVKETLLTEIHIRLIVQKELLVLITLTQDRADLQLPLEQGEVTVMILIGLMTILEVIEALNLAHHLEAAVLKLEPLPQVEVLDRSTELRLHREAVGPIAVLLGVLVHLLVEVVQGLEEVVLQETVEARAEDNEIKPGMYFHIPGIF